MTSLGIKNVIFSFNYLDTFYNFTAAVNNISALTTARNDRQLLKILVEVSYSLLNPIKDERGEGGEGGWQEGLNLNQEQSPKIAFSGQVSIKLRLQ